ncbi:hypothetical protein [Nevskia sp.]|uniref:hypothetical protein n=1 Tax=Nevskia sp. TaxID=1929292 RepID=UPI0025EBBAE7|nr:hypothetical protein [Nevskia sp.]
MDLSKKQQYGVLAGLAVLMAITRYHHFVPVPDASWAIYFIGGFYLKGLSRWAFPALMLEAVAIDYVSTQHLGVSSYCLTPAYAFLVPTHAVLWLGGFWLQGRASMNGRGFGALCASAFVTVSIAFTISNGSFYWLGGRYATPNMAEYLDRFAEYYPHFLAMPCLYIAIAAATHVALVMAKRTAAERAARS